MFIRTYVQYIHTLLCTMILKSLWVHFWLQGLKEQLEESQVDKLKLRGALSALKEDADSSM